MSEPVYYIKGFICLGLRDFELSEKKSRFKPCASPKCKGKTTITVK